MWFINLVSITFYFQVNCRLDSDPCLATERDLYKTYNSGGSYLRNLQVVPLPKMSSYKFENGQTSEDQDEMQNPVYCIQVM